MDGIHDLGGRHGHGTVVREHDEPAFHARWEAAVFAMVRTAGATGAMSNADQFRHAVERIDPRAYLTHTYYGRWLGGLENLLVEAGLLSAAEIDARQRAAPDLVAARPHSAPQRIGYQPAAAGNQRPTTDPPRFTPGQAVRTRAWGVPGHTRLPGYATGRVGRIQTLHGVWVYPDSNAHGLGEQPQHLYTVVFSGAELWGAGADPELSVHLDLFEPYLQALTEPAQHA